MPDRQKFSYGTGDTRGAKIINKNSFFLFCESKIILVTEPICINGCSAYESVIIRFEASPVELNFPTGTELGKKQKAWGRTDNEVK